MSYSNRDWEVWTKEYVLALVERDWAAEATSDRPHPSGHMRFIHLMEGDSILDVACGVGHCVYALPDGVKYLGVDTSIAMLAHAKKRFPEHHFQVGDAYNLKDIPQFDTVIASALLFHLPKIRIPIFQMWSKAKKCLLFDINLLPHKGKEVLMEATAAGGIMHQHPEGKRLVWNVITYDELYDILLDLKGVKQIIQIQHPKYKKNHLIKIIRV